MNNHSFCLVCVCFVTELLQRFNKPILVVVYLETEENEFDFQYLNGITIAWRSLVILLQNHVRHWIRCEVTIHQIICISSSAPPPPFPTIPSKAINWYVADLMLIIEFIIIHCRASCLMLHSHRSLVIPKKEWVKKRNSGGQLKGYYYSNIIEMLMT